MQCERAICSWHYGGPSARHGARASSGERAMKTLFLSPPSYEGFDGGAGSRYQARREVRSFWYPTWLAQAAALVPDSTLIDAPPDDLTLADVIARAAGHDLIIIHTSTPSVAQDARNVAEAQGGAARACASASSARTPWCCPRRRCGVARRSTSSPPASSTTPCGSRRRGRLRRRGRPGLPRRGRHAAAHAAAAADPRPRRVPVRHRRLRAQPDRRELLHRLPAASVRVALHRPRLPQPLHLLPLAADHRRPHLPHPLGRERRSTRWRTRRSSSRRCASSSSTTTPSPTTARAPRRSRAASAGSA